MSLPFIPGYVPSNSRFLGRFISPIADGVAAHYVRLLTRPGDIVLDPFGQSPNVAAEALSLDRRVIVASSNPILRMALALAVQPPALTDLKAALTALGDARVGPGARDRLEVQVKAMYATTCAECHTPTTVDALDWDAEAGVPLQKHYVCMNCGGPREAPPDDADRALAARFGRSGPDYHFLLGLTLDPADPDRTHADETLAVYPARALAAIAAVLHKFETLEVDHAAKRLLAALLVAAFDATTTLAQDRPKILAVPRRYREVNFWHALEGALGLLAGAAGPDRATAFDELLAHPDRPAVYVHAGSMRDLAVRLPEGGCALVLTAPPRPNQAFWTLSSTWVTWLWGREAAEAFRSTLHRRRYDWVWHARALHQPLAAARSALTPNGRLIGMLAEAEPGLNASLLAAAAGAGYDLRAWAYRADTAEGQLEYGVGDTGAAPAPTPEAALAPTVRAAALEFLRSRGEPSRFSNLHFAVWCRAAHLAGWNADEPLSPVNGALQTTLSDKSAFQHLRDQPADDPASGLWFLAEPAGASPAGHPLADRVEAQVLRLLVSGEPVDEQDVLAGVYAAFPGALTPGRALVMACLASYATRGEAGLWQLRAEDVLLVRSGELQTIQAELRALAGRQGFEVAGANPQEWREAGQPAYLFAVLSSAVISPYVLGLRRPARRRFLVLPGGRASLVEHKLRRDPRLRQALGAGDWAVVKFRQVRQMLADANLTRATLEPALAGDPLDGMRQMALPEQGEELP